MVEQTIPEVEQMAVLIRLASPEEIRSWSYGEVKKPDTINYRTGRAEKGGLFCEKIFGPEFDYKCYCGKYNGMKFKGIVCERCGVEITHSSVRATRMGHIVLAAPCAHIWYWKIIPSRIGAILGLKISQLEKIIYYQNYIVTDIKDQKIISSGKLKPLQLLSEQEYSKEKSIYRDGFEAMMGAEALQILLKNTNLEKLRDQLLHQLKKKRAPSQNLESAKRLRVVEQFLNSNVKPEWMILVNLPVIPVMLRPLVLLESGTYASSDLNDLYRRLINRNNRLKKLMEMRAPDVIIRNEKRILQQAVDNLLDNSRSKRPNKGPNNRLLKSLADILKGKQGRFRENLLGKRVDYSARSVIIVGPELKLYQCGIPKKIAIEIYKPFLMRKLVSEGKAGDFNSAGKLIEKEDDCIWDALEAVTKEHPVLLNRAPTLHRMSIQAFEPVLTDDLSIHLHPMVCPPFNADFDGDQMAVHVPLSFESLIDTRVMQMSTNSIISPAHGTPIIYPSQDMVLGVFYMTIANPEEKGTGKSFQSQESAITAYEAGEIGPHAEILVRLPADKQVVEKTGVVKSKNNIYKTTLGRILFNQMLPSGMPFYNYEIAKKELNSIISECARKCSKWDLAETLDNIKDFGFKYATLGGLSLSKDDVLIPEDKWQIIKQTDQKVAVIEQNYREGVITAAERSNQIINLWIYARDQITSSLLSALRSDRRDGKLYLNPIRLMLDSGARGNQDQVRQLSGMRGLMAKPSGKIMETPIKSNFREGLRILEYFESAHGARKGLSDTALKTADAGYLTRKLVDVAHNVYVSIYDCKTTRGILKKPIYRGDKVEVPLSKAIYGRVARTTLKDPVSDEVIVQEGQLITYDLAQKIEKFATAHGTPGIMVRSPITCDAPTGVCALCYGMDLSTGKLAEIGFPAGIIAAQSIGEPGTQLTMRTFHIGGTAIKSIEEPRIYAKNLGKSMGFAKFENIKSATIQDKQTGLIHDVVVNRDGQILIVDERGRELSRYPVPAGAKLKVKDNQQVRDKQLLAEYDPNNTLIIAGKEGKVEYDKIAETMEIQKDPRTGIKRSVIKKHKGGVYPQILIRDKNTRDILEAHHLAEGTFVEVADGSIVKPGEILAKIPKEATGTQDITGGLPRVVELFEARKPKNPAVLAEIEGVVEITGKMRADKRLIIITNPETKVRKAHYVPASRYLRVSTGTYVRVGDPLVEGPLVPHDILKILEAEAVQDYLLREIQAIYRSQGVDINDKHIEIIIAQMMRKVRITTPGDTNLLVNTIIDKHKLAEINEKVKKAGRKGAGHKTHLLGISRAAVQSDSFISAASFQETARVLTEASVAAKIDTLQGLKENIIAGTLIPVGSGTRELLRKKVLKIKEEKEEEEAVA